MVPEGNRQEDEIVKKCRQCHEGMLSVSRENYLYTECGLPNVVLEGVEVRRCPKCGAHEVLLPRVTELLRVISHAIVKKPSRLNGAEIRYLRKSMGWSGVDFAGHIGVDPTTVSRWENDKDNMGVQADRLLRLMIVHGRPVEEYPLEELTKINDVADRESARIEIRPNKGGGWHLAA